jgi:hypothetical protein
VKRAITQALHAQRMHETIGGQTSPSTDVVSYVATLPCGGSR